MSLALPPTSAVLKASPHSRSASRLRRGSSPIVSGAPEAPDAVPASLASAIALRCHRAAHTEPAAGFLPRALERLREPLPFDVATIDLAAPGSDRPRRLCAIGVERRGTRHALTGKAHEAVSEAACSVPGSVVATSRGSPSIAVAVPDPGHRFMLIVRLGRSAGQPGFDDRQQRIVELTTPHLMQAYLSNARIAMLRRRIAGHGSPQAFVELGGLVIERDDEFDEQLLNEWPDADQRRLPAGLARRLSSARGARHWAGRAQLFDWTPIGEATCLVGTRPRSAADSLSRRERAIADLLTSGLTHEAIGRQLAVSATTVRSLVYSAYRKLGARNQAHFVAKYLGDTRDAG